MLPFIRYGIELESIRFVVAVPVLGLGLAWFLSTVQQWTIRKRFGIYIEGWRTRSTLALVVLLTLFVPMSIVYSGLQDFVNNPLLLMLYQIIPIVAFFGVIGAVQAWMLRKHVKPAWLYVLSMIVSGIVMSAMRDASGIVAQFMIYSVTGLTLLYLFGMSRRPETMQAEAQAVERLIDTSHKEEEDFDNLPEDKLKDKQHHWTIIWNRLHLIFRT